MDNNNQTIEILRNHTVQLWPRLMYHPTKDARRVANDVEEAALGSEWSRTQFPEPALKDDVSLEAQLEMLSTGMRKRVLLIEDDLSKVYERLARAEGQIADLTAKKK